jgi:transcriptional regulator with XRE-family HTH domain
MHGDALARKELAALLRARRSRLKPTKLSVKRRTPGLRREEVAERADISTSLYTWLEQGRVIPISPAALDRVANVLGFSADERAYAQQLAHPSANPKRLVDHVASLPIWQSLVDGYRDGLSFVIDPTWQITAWNDAYGYVHGLTPSSAPIERNLIYRLFVLEWDRYADPEATARRFVAKLRADYLPYLGDEKFANTIAQITAANPRFVDFWDDHTMTSPLTVANDSIRVGTLGFYTYRSLIFPTPPELEAGRLCVQLPADRASASILREITLLRQAHELRGSSNSAV